MLQVHKAFDSLQKLRVKLIEASHLDYREVILPLISSFKWVSLYLLLLAIHILFIHIYLCSLTQSFLGRNKGMLRDR